jgi:hypothetical protein
MLDGWPAATIYHAPTDICVMAPDGRLVAGCEALIDARNLEADIERVCTHSDFRQRGFARAAIVECLYRLKAMGIHSAYIMGYSEAALALYGSLGAVDEQEAYTYEYKGMAPPEPVKSVLPPRVKHDSCLPGEWSKARLRRGAQLARLVSQRARRGVGAGGAA